MKTPQKNLLNTGLLGLSIVLLLNVFAYGVLQQDAATALSSGWNGIWLPSYSVWLTLIIVGLVTKRKKQ